MINKKITAVLLCTALLLPCLCGCRDTAEETADTKAETLSEENAESETSVSSDELTEDCGTMLTDIMSGRGKTCVVYSDDAQGTAYNAANEIAEYIRGTAGGSVSLSSDSERPADCDYYIYFGKTSSAISEELAQKLSCNEYGVLAKGQELACSGWLESGIGCAKELLTEVLNTGISGRDFPVSGTVYRGTDSSSVLVNVPAAITDYDFISESEKGAGQLVKKKADEASFAAWKAAFEAAGYEKYAENTMRTVSCVTYINSAAVVNMNYSTADSSLRAVIEDRVLTTLPVREEQAPANGLSSITQVGECNMCYIIKLSDGTFIVIDSGNNRTQNHIRQKLYELADTTLVTVTAWIFTHFHQDHVGGFIDFVASGYTSGIKVKQVIYSFPDSQVLATASSTDRNNMSLWQSTLDSSGAAVSKARTGQVYNFCGCTVEILFTYDDLMPYRLLRDADDSNTTSMIFRVSTCGQKLLFPGDASGVGTKCASLRLMSYLRSDFVQLCHHGYGSGGTFRNFYGYTKASYVFLPGPGTSLGDSEKYATQIAKETFVRGNTSLTLPLPYGD